MTRRNNYQVFIVETEAEAIELINNLTGTRNYENELFEKLTDEILTNVASKITCDTINPKNRKNYITIIDNNLPKKSDEVISKKVLVIVNLIKSLCMKPIEDEDKQFELNKNTIQNCLKSHFLDTIIAMYLILTFLDLEYMMEDLDDVKDDINDEEYLRYCNLFRDIHNFVNLVSKYLEDKHDIKISLKDFE